MSMEIAHPEASQSFRGDKTIPSYHRISTPELPDTPSMGNATDLLAFYPSSNDVVFAPGRTAALNDQTPNGEMTNTLTFHRDNTSSFGSNSSAFNQNMASGNLSSFGSNSSFLQADQASMSSFHNARSPSPVTTHPTVIQSTAILHALPASTIHTSNQDQVLGQSSSISTLSSLEFDHHLVASASDNLDISMSMQDDEYDESNTVAWDALERYANASHTPILSDVDPVTGHFYQPRSMMLSNCVDWPAISALVRKPTDITFEEQSREPERLDDIKAQMKAVFVPQFSSDLDIVSRMNNELNGYGDIALDSRLHEDESAVISDVITTSSSTLSFNTSVYPSNQQRYEDEQPYTSKYATIKTHHNLNQLNDSMKGIDQFLNNLDIDTDFNLADEFQRDFNTIDTDQNGRINLTEYAQIVSKYMHPHWSAGLGIDGLGRHGPDSLYTKCLPKELGVKHWGTYARSRLAPGIGDKKPQIAVQAKHAVVEETAASRPATTATGVSRPNTTSKTKSKTDIKNAAPAPIVIKTQKTIEHEMLRASMGTLPPIATYDSVEEDISPYQAAYLQALAVAIAKEQTKPESSVVGSVVTSSGSNGALSSRRSDVLAANNVISNGKRMQSQHTPLSTHQRSVSVANRAELGRNTPVNPPSTANSAGNNSYTAVSMNGGGTSGTGSVHYGYMRPISNIHDFTAVVNTYPEALDQDGNAREVILNYNGIKHAHTQSNIARSKLLTAAQQELTTSTKFNGIPLPMQMLHDLHAAVPAATLDANSATKVPSSFQWDEQSGHVLSSVSQAQAHAGHGNIADLDSYISIVQPIPVIQRPAAVDPDEAVVTSKIKDKQKDSKNPQSKTKGKGKEKKDKNGKPIVVPTMSAAEKHSLDRETKMKQLSSVFPSSLRASDLIEQVYGDQRQLTHILEPRDIDNIAASINFDQLLKLRDQGENMKTSPAVSNSSKTHQTGNETNLANLIAAETDVPIPRGMIITSVADTNRDVYGAENKRNINNVDYSHSNVIQTSLTDLTGNHLKKTFFLNPQYGGYCADTNSRISHSRKAYLDKSLKTLHATSSTSFSPRVTHRVVPMPVCDIGHARWESEHGGPHLVNPKPEIRSLAMLPKLYPPKKPVPSVEETTSVGFGRNNAPTAAIDTAEQTKTTDTSSRSQYVPTYIPVSKPEMGNVFSIYHDRNDYNDKSSIAVEIAQMKNNKRR